MLKQAGLPLPVPRLITTSIVFGLTLLQEDNYVAGFSENLVQRELKSGSLVALEIDSEFGQPSDITTMLCYRKNLILSQSVSFFIKELERYVSDLDQHLE